MNEITDFSPAEILVASPDLPAASLVTARTTVVTLFEEPETIFNRLADIENLPQWAPGFCEAVSIVNGDWRALTSCGELYLALVADADRGDVTLSAGGDLSELHRFEFQVKPGEAGTTRVKFALAAAAPAEQALIYAALEREVREWVNRSVSRPAAMRWTR